MPSPVSTTVSHELDRRRTLRSLRQGELTRADVCDADRGLLSSAEVLGERVDGPCPVCGKDGLRHSFWIHGTVMGEKSGTARSLSEIDAILATLSEDGAPVGPSEGGLAVHTVEVCLHCGWNHLLREDMYGAGNSSTERTAT